ncbi:MAG: helix-turn-helix transcriptional regulator [Deltaproteobacteria bacterium]|jgi:TetR/AcrR family transcriptional regulator|nr:helix-turn-helix transcriptional regulator [Deltaproteobacteria bacterium]
MGIKERREREKSERRESILKAAIRVYDKEGYHAITMEKIAEAAELSRATLYLYFKTKDEIFIHAILSSSDFFRERLENLYARRSEIKDKLLESLWSTFIEFYEKDKESFNATLYFHQSEMIRNLPENLRILLDHSGSRIYGYLSKIMDYGIEQGVFRDCSAKTLAEVVWTSFLGIIHLENSKRAMSRKGHLAVTWKLALELLSRSILKRT